MSTTLLFFTAVGHPDLDHWPGLEKQEACLQTAYPEDYLSGVEKT